MVAGPDIEAEQQADPYPYAGLAEQGAVADVEGGAECQGQQAGNQRDRQPAVYEWQDADEDQQDRDVAGVESAHWGTLHAHAAEVCQRSRLVVADDVQVYVQAGRREMTPELGLAVTSDRASGQGEPDPAVAGTSAVSRGPGLGGQCLDRLDQLPGRDDLPAGQAQQMVGLAEDLAGGGDAGQLAAQRLLGQAPGDVAGVVAEYGHAIPVRVERGDHERAKRPGTSPPTTRRPSRKSLAPMPRRRASVTSWAR